MTIRNDGGTEVAICAHCRHELYRRLTPPLARYPDWDAWRLSLALHSRTQLCSALDMAGPHQPDPSTIRVVSK